MPSIPLHISFIVVVLISVVDFVPAQISTESTSDPSNHTTSNTVTPVELTSAATTSTAEPATTPVSSDTTTTSASTSTTASMTTEAATSAPDIASESSPPTTPPNQLHSLASSSALCSCDLSVDICDINCCCDDDCTENIKATFSTCLDAVLREDRLPLPSCVSEGIIRGSNGLPFVTEITSNGLFCVKDVNYREQKTFPDQKTLTPTEIKSEVTFAKAGRLGSDFDAILDRKQQLIDVLADDQLELNLTEAVKASTYKAGRPFVRLLSAPNDSAPTCTSFNLPTASDFSSTCIDSSPSPFLEHQKSVCDRDIDGQLEDVCNDAGSVLHSAHYLGNLLPGKVIKSRVNGSDYDVLGCAVPDEPPPLDQPGAVGITIEGMGCEASFNTTKNICDNAVKGVGYCIHVDDNGWIAKVEATFDCGSITPRTVSRIKHEVSFSFGIDGKCGEAVRRSGNPGYLDGKPILAGAYNGSDDVSVGERNVILLDDPLSWLTVPGPSSDGHCSIHSTLFNLDKGNVCQFDFSSFKECSSLRSSLMELFVGKSKPDRVAVFGNSDPQNVLEWIPINDDGLPMSSSSSSSSSSSICNEVVVGVSLQVLFAREGDITNPQSKIVGVARHFKTNKVNLKDTKRLFLGASVTFIDVTKDAENVYKPAPVVSARVPRDFFYPLFQRGAACAVSPSNVHTVIVILAILSR